MVDKKNKNRTIDGMTRGDSLTMTMDQLLSESMH